MKAIANPQPPPRKTTRPRRATTLAAAVLAASVLLVGAAEISARLIIEDHASLTVKHMLHGTVKVRLGPRPALLAAVSKSIPIMTIHVTDAQICDLTGVTVDATVRNVKHAGNSATVSGSQADATLTVKTLTSLGLADLQSFGPTGASALTVVPLPDINELQPGPAGSFT